MSFNRWSRIIALFAFTCFAGAASAQTTKSPDGLVQIKPRKMEMAWLLPGADFRRYTKVIIDRTQVAFEQNWLQDYNLNAQLGENVSPELAAKILGAAQTNFDGILRDAFAKAGYQVVTTTGPDVLRVNSAILHLMLNAPRGETGPEISWVLTAGQAALIVEVRDTVSNALLGRVADERETQDLGLRQIATDSRTLSDFRQLFSLWAGICVRALGELKSVSPVPRNLTPNQSL